MNPAIPMTMDRRTLRLLRELAAEATGCPSSERNLYFAIQELSAEEQAELQALVTLGRNSCRAAYNTALKAAHRQDKTYLAGSLSEKKNLAQYLERGIRRHAQQT